MPPSIHGRTIYTHMCRITNLILARSSHRKRLRGRAQLLLPILRALLRCLFVSTSRGSHNQIQHPHWLDASRRPLTAKQAMHFTRSLTTLFDPSVSSVATTSSGRGKTKNEAWAGPLTDATRAARLQAGQLYGAPLLAELCDCLLKGTYCDHGREGSKSRRAVEQGIRASVRDALMPGIWACLEVMPRGEDGSGGMLEVLGRGMLGSSARAVLKGLLGEWRRNRPR